MIDKSPYSDCSNPMTIFPTKMAESKDQTSDRKSLNQSYMNYLTQDSTVQSQNYFPFIYSSISPLSMASLQMTQLKVSNVRTFSTVSMKNPLPMTNIVQFDDVHVSNEINIRS